MSLASQLAGAMGLASWRAHLALSDYALAAPTGMTFAGRNTPTINTPSALGLNEVGVTDSVMASLWRCGPFRSAASTTGPSEKHHFGADIAIVDVHARRLLLYQAKLGSLNAAQDLALKSRVLRSQVKLLRRQSVEVNGVSYAVSGRLAIYQIDHLPYWLSARQVPLPQGALWPWAAGPTDAMDYYHSVVRPHSFSPCGVLAANVPAARGPVGAVRAASTWPWEFDAYCWKLGRPNPLDLVGLDRDFDFESAVPLWDDDDEEVKLGRSAAAESEYADELHRALRLPTNQQLHVLVL